MHGTILERNNGTNGDFCIRCHTPVGMALEEPLFISNLDRASVSVEGITCVVCHRMDKPYGKVTGRRGLEPGDIFQPMYGPDGGDEFARAVSDPEYGLVTEAGLPGRRVHAETRKFDQQTEPGFCASCHDVTFIDGFRLEEAFSEYKTSPASRRGETCQDCHMGNEPGVAGGYPEGPGAVVGGKPTRSRRLSNHMTAGPDYSVVHPGLFPHNPDARELATLAEWLAFDHQAGWGTDEFEDGVDDEDVFPERWAWPEDRYEAREILDDQQALLAEAFERGTRLLKVGYRLGAVEVLRADAGGLRLRVEVENGIDAHNVPTGFIGERLVWLQVVVSDAAGAVVFQSGDLDPNGDVRDLHSVYVHNGELPLDTQLFTLQSRFLTRMLRGGEREQVLAVNYSADPLPFARPSTSPSILAGRPVGARLHRMGIEPGGRRSASYRVSRDALTGKAPYTAEIRLMAGMVPPNLVHEISGVGFDYGMTPREVADAVVAGYRVLWERSVEIAVE
jgi:nitrate/TMAO reductase-like tetraheme cytochrome c subunit